MRSQGAGEEKEGESWSRKEERRSCGCILSKRKLAVSCSKADPIASIRKSILRFLELESWKLDEVLLLVGKLEVVWSSQVPAGVMYRCTRQPPYLPARQDLGNSEPWILQAHRKITDFITMYYISQTI